MKKLALLFAFVFILTQTAVIHAATEQENDELDMAGWTFRACTEKTDVTYAFDNNPATCYESITNPKEYPPHEIYIDTKKKTAVGGIRYTPPQDSSFDGTMGECEIYASDDGETYYLIGIYSEPSTKETTTYYFDNSVEARYFKLATVATVSGSFRVAELRLLEPQNEILPLIKAEQYVEEHKIFAIDNPGITATADSQQSDYENAAQRAVDNSSATMWHSRFTPVRDELPLSITIDLSRTEYVVGIKYQPRQDSYQNGRFQVCEISTSTDGEHFTYRTKTDWADDASTKYVYFPEVEARYIKINVLEATDGYAIAAEIDALETGIRNRAKREAEYCKYVLKANSTEYSYQQSDNVLTGNTSDKQIVVHDTFMVPLSTLEEVMDFSTVFQEEDFSVTVSRGENTAIFSVDDDRFYYNDIRYNAAEPPLIKDGVVYIPIRALAEIFGYQVSWDETTSEVSIGNDLNYKWYD